MQTIEEKIEKLKEIVKKDAFVTDEKENIIGGGGEKCRWIFDIKKISMNPAALELFVDIFWEKFKDEYPFQIGGQEVASVPFLGAVVLKSQKEGKPVNGFYIRKSRKKQGLQKIIEGEMNDRKIILIDDLINTGKTVNRQLEVIEKEGKKVAAVFTLVNFRKSEDYEFLKEKNIRLVSLFDLPEFGPEFLKNKEVVPKKYFNVLWYFQSPNPEFFWSVPKSAPAIDDEKIYFGSDSGYFWALDQKNGKVVWKYKVNWFPQKGIFSAPAIWRDNVYFGSYDGNLYCLDKETGKRKWIFAEADWIGSSPAVAEDIGLLFIGLEFGLFRKKGGIAAVDLKTGKAVWRYTMPELVHSSPAYWPEKGVVAIGGNDGVAYLFNAKSGKLLWKFETGGDIKYSFVFHPEKNLVIFGSMDGCLYCLDADSGKLAKKYQTEAGIYATPLVYGEKVIFASLDKRVFCLDLDKDEPDWIFPTGGRIFSEPVIIDGRVFFGSNDGIMYEVDPQTGKLVSQFQFTERLTNKIVYNGKSKKFFVLTQANEVYALARQLSTNLFVEDKSQNKILNKKP